MEQVVDVTVQVGGDELVAGTLRVGDPAVSFRYTAGWLADPRAYALDPALPLVPDEASPPAGRALFNAFGDAAPDQWGRELMRLGEQLRARATGSAPRALVAADYLLATRDDVREGALRLRHPGSGRYHSPAPAPLPGLDGLAPLLLATDAVVSASGDQAALGAPGLAELIAAGASIGGAQPKVGVRAAGGGLGIAKFTRHGVHKWDTVGWEKVESDLARRAGIDMAASALVEILGRNVLVVERFDRDGPRRIGFASAFTMLGAADGERHSYLELAELLARHSPAAGRDLEELFRRIVFSILTCNVDDHLRNHAVLRAAGGWSLSPGYDLNPNPESAGEQMLAIDEQDATSSVELAVSVADRYALDLGRAREVVGEVERATRDWRPVALQHGMPGSEIELMAQAFETGERHVAARIAG